jgi:manganese/zinc/iron transport system substrate-binding protein
MKATAYPFLLSLLGLLFVGGWGCQNPSAPNEKPKVVATTTFIGDMLREICGEELQLQCLMGPQTDPHLYKASARDLQKLTQADLIFYHGLHLEGRLQDALSSYAKRGNKVIPLAEHLPEAQWIKDNHGQPDPHVWFDPSLWAQVIPIAVSHLGDLDPDHRDLYEARGAKLIARYQKLDAWAKEKLAHLPKERRFLVSSHDAFNYFGRAYDFQVIGIQGISTVSEAGLGDLEAVKGIIRVHQIPTIFVESSVSHATIERVAADMNVQIGRELFSDALGEPGKIETHLGEGYDLGTYEGMFRHNVNALIDGLR